MSCQLASGFHGTRVTAKRLPRRPLTMTVPSAAPQEPFSPGSSRPTTPTRNWRNPTVYLTSATAAGARWLHAAAGGRPKELERASDSGDEEPMSADGEALERPQLPAPRLAPWELMVALAALSVLICYADRSNISTAIISMAEQYTWEPGQQGVILSAFFAGYICTQLLGGSLSDRYGGKGVLAVGVTAWSVCTLFTPEAAALGLPVLVAMRVAMGLGEGVAFPAIHSLISRGVPASHQSTAVAIVTAASYAGTALAFGISPTIIDKLGWPWVFYLFGVSAVLWLPLWLPLPVAKPLPSIGRSKPWWRPLQALRGGEGPRGGRQPLPRGLETIEENQEQQRLWPPSTPLSDALSPPPSSRATAPPGAGARPPSSGGGARALGEEDDLVSEAGTEWSDGVAVQHRVRSAPSHGTGFAALMRTKEVWAICAAQYTGSWGFYGLLTWLPTFFKDNYHVEIAQLAGFTLWPYVLQGGVGAVSGLLADKLLSRGWSVRNVRRTLQGVGMLGAAGCMLLAVSPLTDGSPSAASAWVSLGLGLNALTLAGVSVSHLDIAPRNAGVIFAAGNTAATAAGLLAVPVTGVVLSATHSWSLVFGITAAHYVVGAAVFGLWVGEEPLPQDG